MPRSPFATPKGIEREYGSKLKKIAKNIFGIVNRFFDRESGSADRAVEKLTEYGEALSEWAKTSVDMVAKRMKANSEKDWKKVSKRMSKQAKIALQKKGSPEDAAQIWMNEQVDLITSLPREAAERAQKIAFDAVVKGERYETIQKEIKSLGEITDNRAKLIARTEVARANALINKAKAQSIGVTRYIWRTMEDESVRSKHRALNGLTFEYANPPEIPGEGRHGPGEFCNCRCYAEPVIPLEEE